MCPTIASALRAANIFIYQGQNVKGKCQQNLTTLIFNILHVSYLNHDSQIFLTSNFCRIFVDTQQIDELKTIPALQIIASGHKMRILNAPPSKKIHMFYTNMKDPARKA